MAISSRYLVASASTVLLVILLASQSSLAEDEETITYSTTTSFIQKWHGEFIGAVNIPIDESIDGWEITITFEKNIFDFEVCAAQVTEIEDKRVIHLKNQSWNSGIAEGGELYFTFNAKTWKKIRGLFGKVEFTGNVVVTIPTEDPDLSSSGGGFDNELAVCTGANVDLYNNTCGSSFELISASSGISIVEVQMNVDFSDGEESIRITSTEALTWMSIDGDFDMCLTTDDDIIVLAGALTIESNTVRNLNLDVSEDAEDMSGRLKFRFRYPASNSGAYLFPFMEESNECPCHRLEVIQSE